MQKEDLPRPVRKAGRKKTEWDEAAIDARDMETLFAEIPNGFTVRIYRREPSWCAGLCGEMFKDADAPISVSDIQARYCAHPWPPEYVRSHARRG